MKSDSEGVNDSVIHHFGGLEKKERWWEGWCGFYWRIIDHKNILQNNKWIYTFVTMRHKKISKNTSSIDTVFIIMGNLHIFPAPCVLFLLSMKIFPVHKCFLVVDVWGERGGEWRIMWVKGCFSLLILMDYPWIILIFPCFSSRFFILSHSLSLTDTLFHHSVYVFLSLPR